MPNQKGFKDIKDTLINKEKEMNKSESTMQAMLIGIDLYIYNGRA